MALNPNPVVMQWALERSGIAIDSLQKKWPKITSWLDGTAEPTLKQIQDFAKKTHVNLNLLFADEVPDMSLQIADFRTVGNVSPCPSPELYDTVNDMLYRQDWMSSYFAEEEYDPISLVGMFREVSGSPDNTAEMAAMIRDYLGLEEDWAFGARDYSEALRQFKSAVEAKRISVVINGVVGDNTSRPLNVDEFRGFVLSDRFAPIVFVNGRDAKSAQIFTLAHELAHLGFADTGLSSPNAEIEAGTERGRRCDAIAAELLIPAGLFVGFFADADFSYEHIKKVAKLFKVSALSCARKAHELRLIGDAGYSALCSEHHRHVLEMSRKGKGGNYYLTKSYRIGSVFGDAVFIALNTNRISHRDAYRLTGLNYKTFDEYFKGHMR